MASLACSATGQASGAVALQQSQLGAVCHPKADWPLVYYVPTTSDLKQAETMYQRAYSKFGRLKMPMLCLPACVEDPVCC